MVNTCFLSECGRRSFSRNSCPVCFPLRLVLLSGSSGHAGPFFIFMTSGIIWNYLMTDLLTCIFISYMYLFTPGLLRLRHRKFNDKIILLCFLNFFILPSYSLLNSLSWSISVREFFRYQLAFLGFCTQRCQRDPIANPSLFVRLSGGCILWNVIGRQLMFSRKVYFYSRYNKYNTKEIKLNWL